MATRYLGTAEAPADRGSDEPRCKHSAADGRASFPEQECKRKGIEPGTVKPHFRSTDPVRQVAKSPK